MKKIDCWEEKTSSTTCRRKEKKKKRHQEICIETRKEKYDLIIFQLPTLVSDRFMFTEGELHYHKLPLMKLCFSTVVPSGTYYIIS